jgi:hypothetical protein
MKFKNLLAFLVLVSGDDIVKRAPSYLEEKFKRMTGLTVDQVSDTDDNSALLDSRNKAVYSHYLRYWSVAVGTRL